MGTVARAHGTRGELRVAPPSESLLSARHVQIAQRLFAIRSARAVPGATLIEVEGIADRSAAERLRGSQVALRRDELPPLDSGEYYVSDLIGCEVLSNSGQRLGVVLGVENYGAGDLMRLGTTDEKERLISLAQGALREVRIQDRQIIIDDPGDPEELP